MYSEYSSPSIVFAPMIHLVVNSNYFDKVLEVDKKLVGVEYYLHAEFGTIYRGGEAIKLCLYKREPSEDQTGRVIDHRQSGILVFAEGSPEVVKTPKDTRTWLKKALGDAAPKPVVTPEVVVADKNTQLKEAIVNAMASIEKDIAKNNMKLEDALSLAASLASIGFSEEVTSPWEGTKIVY